VLPQSKKAADFFALVLAGSFFADRRVFSQLLRRPAAFSPIGSFFADRRVPSIRE
jgi:hypothetical protein